MAIDADTLREMMAALPDPVFVITESGRYAFVAGGTDAEFYHDGSHLVGQSLHDVMPEGKADRFLEEVRKTLQGGGVRTVEYALAADDVEGLDKARGPAGDLWFEGRIQPMAARFEGERAVVWVARNITARSELEAELRHMTVTDALTGAYNRRKLMEELRHRVREYQRYRHPSTLIIFDVDHFKRVNDSFGHAVGDEVLVEMTTLCRQQLRDVDLLCRIGGEEFAVLMPSTDLDRGKQAAERLRTVVEGRVLCRANADVRITLSVGVSTFAPTDSGTEAIVQRADDALYRAKRGGRNTVVVAAA